MQWFIVAPFQSQENDQWLGQFVPPGRHQFQSVPPAYLHDRSRKATSGKQWLDYFRQARQAKKIASQCLEPAGLITNFPQLPLALGGLQRLARRRTPILAWSFNIGTLPEGFKRVASKAALSGINKFVVHSTAEIGACSEWLGLPKERFDFVPLQRPVAKLAISEDLDSPFILSMGSAGRDYALLFQALEDLPYRTIVVAGKHALEGLKVPANVEIRRGLSLDECHALLQRARFSVTPIANTRTASGQVTLIDAMNYAKAQVVTRCPGSVDYVDHRKQALLIEPGDVDALKESLRELWEHDAFRKRLAENGRARMIAQFSDAAAGKRLGHILDALEDELNS